jgi:hypothetical protein
MNAKRACLVALVMTLAGVGAARAQQFGSGPYGPTPSAPAALPAPAAQPGPVDGPVPPPTGPRLSDFILGTSPDCCGPLGADGPISIEIYTRAGVSAVLPEGYLGKVLTAGWVIEGGGRTLFFDAEADAAWTLDLGLSNVNNHGQHSDRTTTLRILEPNALGTTSFVNQAVSVRTLNRTFANASFGREWYLWNCAANCPSCGRMNDGPNWRIGIDGGGRWGTEKMEFHEIKHRTEVVPRAPAGVHRAGHPGPPLLRTVRRLRRSQRATPQAAFSVPAGPARRGCM